jgi:hypothetical protein
MADAVRCQQLREALANAEDALLALQALPDADPLEIRALISDVRRLQRALADCLRGPDLTGVWVADDGANYYIRQVGSEIWWVGLSTESAQGSNDFHLGLTFSNVFQGALVGDTIRGDWADVPRGIILQNGTLTLRLNSPDSPTTLTRAEETGHFGASTWNKVAVTPGRDIRFRFDHVFRNDGGTMHDHLKMYMDHVVAIGKVVGELGAHVPLTASRRYENFMCNVDGDFDEDDFDGDITFFMVVERPFLEAQLAGPVTESGPFNDLNHIRRKLDATNPNGRAFRGLRNLILPELIMYGRPAGKLNCPGDVPPLLPGWMEAGANSILFDGRPLGGLVLGSGGQVTSPQVTVDQRVRVAGFLALDCHGGDCEEDDALTNNVELHPVYGIDLFRPDVNRRNLTGAWSADDAGTYYVRQIDEQVWWLGLSRDEGRTFANVLRGTLQPTPEGPQIVGRFVDVPLGRILNSGELTISAPNFFTLNFARGSTIFGARRWEKMREAGVIGPLVG